MERAKVAIIGGGVAGLACADALRERGITANIYDKGRGPGGRCSSRRTPFGRFDHGAQFFTARDDRFAAKVADWERASLVAPWDARLVRIEDGETSPMDAENRWVGIPKFNAFVAHEADRLGVQFGLRLGQPKRKPNGTWQLIAENGQSAWEAEWLVIAIPAEQTVQIMPRAVHGGSDALAAEAAAARSDPTWTLMAAFDRPQVAPFDAAALTGGPLAWVARDTSKPDRTAGATETERWVAHASSGWSRSHLDDDETSVITALTRAFGQLVGSGARPIHAGVHRWRYAQVAQAADSPYGLDADAQLATCGDWRIAPRVEAAWVSGDKLGQALAARFS